MKNTLMLIVLSIMIMACKDQEKKKDPMKQPDVNENSIETNNDPTDMLQLGCYEYKTEGNDVNMEVTKIEGNEVTANLIYAYAEKDKNIGTFFGNLNGDKLIGTYTFMSEGVESTREVAFKVEKGQIQEGFGELDKGGTMFADTTKITYSTTTPWKKVNCN